MRRLYSLMAILTAVSILAPTVAMAEEKALNPNGSIPKKWNLPKPTVEQLNGSGAEGGNGDGRNNLQFKDFNDGDFIVVGGKPPGHAGEWDSRFAGEGDPKCIWSANTTPINGVQRERRSKYNDYDYAYGLWVPRVLRAKRYEARNFCQEQDGEPYNIMSLKTDKSQWYCSKLVWASYRYTSGIDLDGDGGPFVKPLDLVVDSDTAVFTKAD